MDFIRTDPRARYTAIWIGLTNTILPATATRRIRNPPSNRRFRGCGQRERMAVQTEVGEGMI